VIAGVAEGELEAISSRNLGSQKKVRQLGRWHGGVPPYGYGTDQNVPMAGIWLSTPKRLV